jgi:hypothetical protein
VLCALHRAVLQDLCSSSYMGCTKAQGKGKVTEACESVYDDTRSNRDAAAGGASAAQNPGACIQPAAAQLACSLAAALGAAGIAVQVSSALAVSTRECVRTTVQQAVCCLMEEVTNQRQVRQSVYMPLHDALVVAMATQAARSQCWLVSQPPD